MSSSGLEFGTAVKAKTKADKATNLKIWRMSPFWSRALRRLLCEWSLDKAVDLAFSKVYGHLKKVSWR
jgi:hypothetical protein